MLDSASLIAAKCGRSRSIPLWLLTFQSISLLPICGRHPYQGDPRDLIDRKCGLLGAELLQGSKTSSVRTRVSHQRQLEGLRIVPYGTMFQHTTSVPR